MRRKLKNFRNKNGHSENGAPRQLVDEALQREFLATLLGGGGANTRFDSEYSGWSNPSRPRDQAITIRTFNNGPR